MFNLARFDLCRFGKSYRHSYFHSFKDPASPLRRAPSPAVNRAAAAHRVNGRRRPPSLRSPGPRNYRADMTVLIAGHIAGLGAGIVPKRPTGFV